MIEICIGTRGSALALAQAEQVAGLLVESGIAEGVSLEIIRTSGDRIQDRSLAAIGGKGLFIKEIEEALLEGRVDLAVHSMKDVPGFLAPGLTLTATLPREESRDALIACESATSLAQLPQGAVVGTSSLRRRAQVLVARPDVEVIPLRGNVDTRIRKLEERVDGLDAILLAEAGLRRLGLSEVTKSYPIPIEIMLPAVGQGALALECREEDSALREALVRLDDENTASCVTAERALLSRLGGSCQVPVAGLAVLSEDNTLWLRGLVCDPDGARMVRSEIRGAPETAKTLGVSLAEALLEKGGRDILYDLGIEPPEVLNG